MINRYHLKEKECLFIDDNIHNIRTANEIGMIGRLVEPNNCNDVFRILKSEINFDGGKIDE